LERRQAAGAPTPRVIERSGAPRLESPAPTPDGPAFCILCYRITERVHRLLNTTAENAE
jgi:hypothetical protein